jgi:glycopeptide antibiotics resistance protein
VVGFTPNLIGSFLLPFGACWLFQRFFRLQTTADLRFTCSVGLLLVIINEYLQLIPVFGRTFDYLDILFSVVGVVIGYHVFAKLQTATDAYHESVA